MAIDYQDERPQSDNELELDDCDADDEMDSADEASSSSVANELYYPLLFSTFNAKLSSQRQVVLRNQESLILTPYVAKVPQEIEEKCGRMKVSARRSTHEWQRELRSVVTLERRRSFSGFSLQTRSSEIVYESLPRAGSLRTVRTRWSSTSVGLGSRGKQLSGGPVLCS